LELEQIEAVTAQFEALESLRNPQCSCESANRLWKDLNLSSVLLGKAFRPQPDCERVSDFAAQQHRPSQRI